MEIDDTLADAHAALAVIHSGYDWDWQGADSEFQRALNLSPNQAGIRQAYCRYLLPMGRRDFAISTARQTDAAAASVSPPR